MKGVITVMSFQEDSTLADRLEITQSEVNQERKCFYSIPRGGKWIANLILTMTHTIGFDANKIRKGQRRYECYRNFFAGNNEYLDEAVELGLAVSTWQHRECTSYKSYAITQKGLEMLSKIYNIRIECED